MGFQGFLLNGITIVQPQKKPPGRELTPPEKASNRAISSIRIRIEHAIGGVKRSRIVKDRIRLLKDGIRDTIMETCCGLHNFRLQYRPWHYAHS
jgi:DDE superfamily endonuclease